jgi:hypothetical protein
MPTRALIHTQKALVARNWANCAKSTGPRTAAGKAVSAKNALTHGLTAQTARDEADVADRDRRIAELAAVIEPRDAYEQGLLARLASAFQRLKRADHLESQSFDVAPPIGPQSAGAILTLAGGRHAFERIERDRAAAGAALAGHHQGPAALRRVEGAGEAQLRNEPRDRFS